MVGSQYNRKNYMKNGAMSYYIKVLLWTPAECMRRGTIKSRIKEKNWCPNCCSRIVLLPKDVRNLESPNFLVVKMRRPLKRGLDGKWHFNPDKEGVQCRPRSSLFLWAPRLERPEFLLVMRRTPETLRRWRVSHVKTGRQSSLTVNIIPTSFLSSERTRGQHPSDPRPPRPRPRPRPREPGASETFEAVSQEVALIFPGKNKKLKLNKKQTPCLFTVILPLWQSLKDPQTI